MGVDLGAGVDVGAISPSEAQKIHLGSEIPKGVYVVFNRILSRRFASSIIIKQEEVIEGVIEQMQSSGKNVTARYILDHHWLDIEPAYETQGWKVKFYKPGYDEKFKSYWEFTAPKDN